MSKDYMPMKLNGINHLKADGKAIRLKVVKDLLLLTSFSWQWDIPARSKLLLTHSI